MPIEFFNKEIILCMSNQIGRATEVDEAAAAVSCCFARVYAKVDLDKPLVPCVQLIGRVQRVEYEGLHIICFRCDQYGHQNETCTRVKPLPSDPSQAPPSAASVGDESSSLLRNHQSLGLANCYGPSIIPYPHRRPHQPLSAHKTSVPGTVSNGPSSSGHAALWVIWGYQHDLSYCFGY